MRTDCKHYESRTYRSGDTMRRCRLDLAPEAPWRCPAECASYERRLLGAGWTVGSLGADRAPEEPNLDELGGVAELLDAAENIVNAVGPEVVADVSDDRRGRGRLRRWWRRLPGVRRRGG